MNTSKHSPQVGIKALSRNWLPDIMGLVVACWLALHLSNSFAYGLQAASDYATPAVTSSAPFPNSQTFYPTLSYPAGFHVLKLEMPFPTSGQDLCSEFSSIQALQPFKTTGFNPNWCQNKQQMRRVYLATPPGTPPAAGWPVVMLLAVQESQTDNQHYRQTPTSSPDFINRMIFSNNWSWPEAQGNPSSLPFSYGYYVRSHLLQGLLSKGIAVLYVMPWAQQADSTGYNLDDWAFWEKNSNMGPALTWNSANDKPFFENLFAQLQQHQLNGYQIDTDLKSNQAKGSQHQATNSLKGLTSQAAPLDLNNLFIMGYSSAAQMTSRLLNEFPTMQPIDSSGAQLPTKMPNIRGAIMVSGGSYLCYSDLQGTADNNLTCPDQVYNSGGSCCPPNITEPYYAQGTHKHPPVLLAQSSFDGYADHNASVFYKARMDQIAPGQAHMITSVTDQNVTHIFFPEMVIPTINFVLDHLSYNQKQATTYPLSAKTSAYLHFIYPKIPIGQLPDASYIDKNIALLYWPALHSLSSNQNLGSGGSTWQGNDLLGTAWEGFQHISNTRSSITNDSGWKMPLYNDIWDPSFFPQSTYASFIAKYNPFNISAFTQQSGFKDNQYIEISSTGHDWFAYYAPGSGTFINLKHTLAAPNKISAVFQLYKQSQNQSSSSGNLNYLDFANYLLSIDHDNWTNNDYLQGQDFSNAQTQCQQDPQAKNYIGSQDNQRLACLLYIASSMSPQHPIAKASDSISATSASAQAYAINDYNDMGGYWDLFIAAYAQKLGYDTVQMTTQPNEDGGWMFELADIDLIQKSHQPLSSMLSIQHKSTRSGWHAAPDKPILSGGFDTSVPLYTCSQLAADGACAPNKQYPSGTSSWFGVVDKGSCNPNISCPAWSVTTSCRLLL